MINTLSWKMWWREETIRPNGDGFYFTFWIKSSDCGPGSAYTMVDEAVSDLDSTFIESDGVNGGGQCLQATGLAKESFTMENPSAIASGDSILRVTARASRRRPGGTPASYRTGMREGSTDSFGTAATAPTSYAEDVFTLTSKPSGGAWTLSAVNGTEVIVETTSLCTTCSVRVTQVYAVVEYVVIPGADLNLALSGNAATTAAGSITPPRALAQTGNQASAGLGSVAPAWALSATGNALTAAIGGVGITDGLALGGLAATAAVGAVTASGGDAAAVSLLQINRVWANRRGPTITIKGRG